MGMHNQLNNNTLASLEASKPCGPPQSRAWKNTTKRWTSPKVLNIECKRGSYDGAESCAAPVSKIIATSTTAAAAAAAVVGSLSRANHF